MSLEIVFAALGGGTAAAAAIGWLLKTVIERGIEAKLATIRKQQELLLIESQRQKSFIWDKQFDVHKTMLSLMYRMKNSLMDLAASIESQEISPEQDNLVRRMNAYGSALRELLYENRALLADDIFPFSHELASMLERASPLLHRMEKRLTGLAPKPDDRVDLEALRSLAKHVETLYGAATKAVQSKLHTASDA